MENEKKMKNKTKKPDFGIALVILSLITGAGFSIVLFSSHTQFLNAMEDTAVFWICMSAVGLLTGGVFIHDALKKEK